MTGPALPIDIDTTYADDGGDASVKLHQQYHDSIHGIVNQFDTTLAATSGQVPVGDGTVFVNRALLSTDIPGVTINAQSGTSYTLVLGDAGKLVKMTNGSANTVTVPPNSSVAFPVGTVVSGSQYGAGATTLTEGSGVTINSRDTAVTTSGQYAGWVLTKIATDEWLLEGDLA